MPVVKVELPGELSQEVASLVESKRYKSTEEVLLTALRRLVHHERAIIEAVEGRALPEALTAKLTWSDGQCCAYCPELDLATAADTEEEALTELAEMAIEYAEDYLDEFETYAYSPDRASHLPFISKVASLTTDVYDEEGVRKIKALFQRRHSAL